MRFYSDSLHKFFDTEKDCVKAEKDYTEKLQKEEAEKKALLEKRSTRAKEVEALYKEAVEAKKAYDKALQEFLKDYESFHMTVKTTDPFFGIFDWF